jgi:anaerobic magnesium-protoporphyrin IX monomethyl ester cyclase
MKVVLINPPRENELVGNNPPLIDEERGHNPPLGLLYLGAYLKANSSHEVEAIDSQVEELTYPELKARISSSGPDVVGISAMTFTLLDVLKTARLVKELDRTIPVVVGDRPAGWYRLRSHR